MRVGTEEEMTTEETAILDAEADAIDLALLNLKAGFDDELMLLAEALLLGTLLRMEDERREGAEEERRLLEAVEDLLEGLLLLLEEGATLDVLEAELGMEESEELGMELTEDADDEEGCGAQMGLHAGSPHFTTFRS